MRRLIWLPIAGFLLVAGAAIAAAAAAPSVIPAAQTNQDAASPGPSSAAASPSTNNDQNGNGDKPGYGLGFGHGMIGAAQDMLDQVLADLVTAGTITQDQSDAITRALQQAITDQQTQLEQQRQQAMQEWQLIQGFLQDGVITQDEVNQLPADSPFRQVFDSIVKNGQVTLDQLQQLRLFGPGMAGPEMGRPDMGGPGGDGPFGPGGPWGNDNGQNQNPQASPITTGTSS